MTRDIPVTRDGLIDGREIQRRLRGGGPSPDELRLRELCERPLSYRLLDHLAGLRDERGRLHSWRRRGWGVSYELEVNRFAIQNVRARLAELSVPT
jgi:hypothetical protein